MASTIIRPKDLSALSLIAHRPGKSRALVERLSKEARPIGLALTGRALPGKASSSTKRAIETARYLYRWGGAQTELPVRKSASRLALSPKSKAKSPAKKKAAAKKKKH